MKKTLTRRQGGELRAREKAGITGRKQRWKANSSVGRAWEDLFSSLLFTGSSFRSTDGCIHRRAFYCIFPSPINSLYLHLCVGNDYRHCRHHCCCSCCWLNAEIYHLINHDASCGVCSFTRSCFAVSFLFLFVCFTFQGQCFWQTREISFHHFCKQVTCRETHKVHSNKVTFELQIMEYLNQAYTCMRQL